MGTNVELIYQYRQLAGRCDAGTGLDFDEIDALLRMEVLLASQPPIDRDNWHIGIDHREHFEAVLRGPRIHDDVAVTNLGPKGCVCRRAPFAEEGATVELMIEDSESSVSYRFKAEVRWLEDEDDDFVLGLHFLGVPLQVRYATAREHGDLGRARSSRAAA
ncbi:PilZ domain-containing protein [Haliangium ochraceum]|uniref:PilZ domain-containing protein n=1 Tax=Haliangium ochraceum (strain DSM 14365 / JCM 11303 / SMP-2) TaxID=502025 RepID=D0LV61_HALO1|nr:PilZ domain-containing protein [Haliangium ochraceum]ACY15902.1 hypothetical protein Hoch_3400 [Haliangium ochraceum DSM 14365]